MLECIVALEHQFDRYLLHPRVAEESCAALTRMAVRWSTAIWSAAAAQGPIELDQERISQGLDLAFQPVFICGAHRSGTTLVRNLLDAHPALSVLPSEGTFFTGLQRHLLRLPRERWLCFVGCEWLRRLANPSHQAPYWLLGRSSQSGSPYIEFARQLMAWWCVAEANVAATASSWPLVAAALAYAHSSCGPGVGTSLRRWVEKTPTNERFLDRLRAEFPRARIVHLVRHPYAVLASHAQEARNSGGRSLPHRRMMRNLRLSYRVAANRAHDWPDGSYLVVRYEDLLDAPQHAIERLARFIDIEASPTLLRPTVAGVPAASNSSFRADGAPGRIESEAALPSGNGLDRLQRERLTAALGNAPERLGYRLEPLSRQRRAALRIAAWVGVS